MRSKLVVCAALAGTCFLGAWSQAHAADPKSKKKIANDSDDKVIDKQMQWEDSVMGPDDKRAELEKIARAQAINKAAAEKAAREKEKADAAAKEAAAREAAAPKSSKRGGEVALPTVPDEDSTQRNRETAAATPPPPPVKHGDDKFIDKLLKDDGKGSKKRASASDDKALNDLLAVDKPKAAPKAKGRKDDVDALLLSADKQAPMPETHVKHETPEWAKPEIESTPAPVPVAIRPQPKRDDGIIHVVQGAAQPSGTMVPASRRSAEAASRPATVATRTAAGRRQAAPAAGGWDDPFAASSPAPKKRVAARESGSGADDLDGAVAQPRRRASSRGRGADGWNDPFKAGAKAAPARRAAPAKPAKWKDPFTEAAPAPLNAIVA